MIVPAEAGYCLSGVGARFAGFHQRASAEAAGREEAMAQGGSHAGHAGTYTHVDAGRSEAQAPEKETAAVYACPMHPEVTSNAPGTCSKCGMALVERREE